MKATAQKEKHDDTGSYLALLYICGNFGEKGQTRSSEHRVNMGYEYCAVFKCHNTRQKGFKLFSFPNLKKPGAQERYASKLLSIY